MKSETKTVVIVWTETESEPYGPMARVDLGERRPTRDITVARAALWAAEGDAESIAKAKTYAGRNGYRVFVCGTDVSDWKEAAKAWALRAGARA